LAIGAQYVHALSHKITERKVMNDRMHQIIEQIGTLEAELNAAIDARQSALRYRIEGKRVTFEHAVRDAHQRVKQGVFRWFLTVRPQNYLTMPVIYAMGAPLILFDLCVSVYQLVCFPVYRIARVKHADYMLFDHQKLEYLNIIEKIHCIYCSYAVGVMGYAQEITARTEQYFCPIKHAHKVLGAHRRYKNYLDYGEADDFHRKLEAFRSELAEEAKQARKQQSGGS
jgi:hypothetical protein